jgi:DNA-binding CsgD family transcriptional regulator/tetratricopeptide (TPR) repeat protein
VELWERAEALASLDDLLRSGARGGRIAVVAGEAGIGKSALVGEFVRRCGARARVLWGGCDRLVTPRALGPLHDIGRQVGGALAQSLRAGDAQDVIFDAFMHELSATRQRPTPVVVVEDAHWADEATLDWLTFMGRRIGRTQALIVVTVRDDELGPEHSLRGALAALPSAIVRRMTLPPLSQECVVEQSRLAGRDAAAVRRLAGGNPLLVTELLKADGPEVPDVVQDLILDRLRGVPGPARELAQLVAVVPTRADGVLLAAVDGGAEAAEACVAAGVLATSGDGLAFRHELLRGAVEESLSPTRRQTLHQRVLRVLSEVPEIDPGRLVHHARLAGDAAAVLRFGQVAGANAAQQGARREATEHYRAAAEHADRLPPDQRAQLFKAYATQGHLAGSHEEALRARQVALEVREGLGVVGPIGENLRWISRLAWWTGDAAQARDAASRALQVLESAPASRELAMAYSNRAQLHAMAYEIDAAVTWGERARDLAQRLGDVDTAVHAMINIGTARIIGGHPDAQALLEQAHEVAAAHGFAENAGRALCNLASGTAEELARYADAEPLADRALAYATATGLENWVEWLHGARAEIRFERGDWRGAMADSDASLAARAVRRGLNVVAALVVRGRIQSARAEPEALATLDEVARLTAGVHDVQYLRGPAEARAEHFRWAGDMDRARTELQHVLDVAASVSPQPFTIGRLVYRLWLVGGSDERVDALVATPGLVAEPYQMMIKGDWAGAAREWEVRGAVWLRAEALAAGDHAAATEALRVFDSLGAVRAATHLRNELRRRGLARVPRGPRRTATNAAGLTPRQLDVLRLLAEGGSNAEIARRLSLSPKTVDHHVSAVLAKLGVTSRSQAVASAHRLKLVPGTAS